MEQAYETLPASFAPNMVSHPAFYSVSAMDAMHASDMGENPRELGMLADSIVSRIMQKNRDTPKAGMPGNPFEAAAQAAASFSCDSSTQEGSTPCEYSGPPEAHRKASLLEQIEQGFCELKSDFGSVKTKLEALRQTSIQEKTTTSAAYKPRPPNRRQGSNHTESYWNDQYKGSQYRGSQYRVAKHRTYTS